MICPVRHGWGLSVLLVVVLGGCAPEKPVDLEAEPAVPPPSGEEVETEPEAPPAGTVRVAYPDVPGSWTGTDPVDVAAMDLAALWSLPLYRYDADGQLVPGLVSEVTFPAVPDGWAVELSLKEGSWSDGSSVTAEDVVATVEALAADRPGEWRTLRSVTTSEGRVRLHFDGPHGRWADLLTGAPGVLPARTLATEGLEAYRQGLPVVGGWFSLDAYDPGRSAVFVANRGTPLGAPRVERIEVAFVPSYETALGLLDRDEVDIVLGHLALNPVDRAEELSGVRAAAPIGGTLVTLEWLPSGSLGGSASARRDAFGAIDLRELVAGLLAGTGEPATSPVPGIEGPLTAADEGGGGGVRGEVVVLVPRWHEALGFTSRAIQRDLSRSGGVARLVAVETPALLEPVDPHDGALRVRRSGPRPAIRGTAGDVPPGPPEVRASDLAPAFADLAEDSWELPLYRIGVAHAWAERVRHVEASSWPGLALWDVGNWTLDGDS